MIDDGRLPFFHCYPGKLLGALAGMQPDQQLVYTVVLLRIYEVRGPCPDSVEVLARRISINKRRIADALHPLFVAGKLTQVEGGIMNPFAAKVLAEGQEIHERLARAGARGGARSGQKRKKTQSPTPSPASAGQQHLDLDEVPVSPNGDTPPRPAAPVEMDARTKLFRTGLDILKRISGRNDGGCRTLIGKWLRTAQDDAITVMAAIEDAEHQRVANPVPWIERALSARGGGQARIHNAWAAMAAEDAREEINERSEYHG